MNGDAWTSHHQTVNSNIVATFQPASLTQLFSIIYLRVISTQFFLLLFFLLTTRSSTRDPFVFPRFFFPSFFFFFCPPIIDTGSNSEGPRGEGEPFRSTIEATRPGASNGKKKKKNERNGWNAGERGYFECNNSDATKKKRGRKKRRSNFYLREIEAIDHRNRAWSIFSFARCKTLHGLLWYSTDGDNE